jgi:hypothetical protein
VASRNATPDTSKHPKSSKQMVPPTDILPQPHPASPTVRRLAPLTLSNPAMVEKHTLCTLHLGTLPLELACRLFYRMVNTSKSAYFCYMPLFLQLIHHVEWTANKWWMFDRLMDSPHKTSLYARKVDGASDDESWHETAQCWSLPYLFSRRTANVDANGLGIMAVCRHPLPCFRHEMEEACELIRKVVNDVLESRSRYPLE